ncbi:hypothetical protein GCM10010434_055390 [Winogradskya humida]
MWAQIPTLVGPGRVVPMMTPVGVCTERYYDPSAEPIATCGCGKLASAVCGQCGQYRCADCVGLSGGWCRGCTGAGAQHARSAALARERQIGVKLTTIDPIERLLQVAMWLDGITGDEVYPLVSRLCPYLDFRKPMTFRDPAAEVRPYSQETVPWDSAIVGRWVAADAARRNLPPGTQVITLGRPSTSLSGWWLFRGSNNRNASGQAADAFVAQSGAVVHAENPITDRGDILTKRLVPTGLNLRALSQLGRILDLRLPG